MARQTPQTGQIAAWTAIAATAYFAVAAIAAHLVSTQYDFVRDYISDYAVGPYGWIYGTGFVASFVACAALAVALWQAVPDAARSRAGLVLLVIVGVTLLIDLFFPTDILAPGQPPQTTIGKIHFAAALLGWILFVVSAFMVSGKLKHAAYWQSLRGSLLALAWLTLIVLLVLVGVVVTKRPIGGLVEKTFILVRNIWALVLAIAVLRRSRDVAPAGTDGGIVS